MGSRGDIRQVFTIVAAAGFVIANSLGVHSAVRDGQELQPTKSTGPMAQKTTDGAINFVQIDMNFDGKKDLVVVQREELATTPSFLYFLYDEQQKRFARNLELSALTAPEFDPRTKRVRTGWRTIGESKVSEIYGWSSNTLRLLERKELNLKTQSCVSFRYAWINDEKWELGQRAC